MLDSIRSRLLVEFVDGITLLTFADDHLISEDVLTEVGNQLEMVRERSLSRVVVNLQEVRLMSGAFLASLLRFSRRVAAAGGRLKLCSIRPELMEVFKLTCFDRLFEIYVQESSALDSF